MLVHVTVVHTTTVFFLQFLNVPAFRNITLKCLNEIGLYTLYMYLCLCKIRVSANLLGNK